MPERNRRILLSPPHLSGVETDLLLEAIESNWIAPAGPMLDRFEREFADLVGVSRSVALSSGTAAIHLALMVCGVKPGDHVLCPTLTFAASAFPIMYIGAHPVLIDCDPSTWTIDPSLVDAELGDLAESGSAARAVVSVDLLGHSADYDALIDVCDRYGVVLIEDAAQAVGSTYKGQVLGRFGRVGCFSFNGNKIITTSSGGMLVSDEEELVEEARHIAGQARAPVPHYEHERLGFNYRMSNLLAAIGLGQLQTLEERVRARRRNFEWYRQGLGDLPGITFSPQAAWAESNRWLSCVLIDEESFGASREDVRLALDADDIESRPFYRPLHDQKPFAGYRVRGGLHAESIFRDALCLPSGNALTEEEGERVIEVVRRAAGAGP
jgi:dTDP-4-amino-4,6-dideoxygalactose transaminase